MQGRPFSRSYGAILPSSFSMVLPNTLGYSPRPPELVYSTVQDRSPLGVFLGGPRGKFAKASLRFPAALGHVEGGFATPPPCSGRRAHPSARMPSLPRHPIGRTTSPGPRNVDLVPIGYACRPRLRGRLTLRGLALRRKPWAYGVEVSRFHFRYSCQHSRFRCLHHASRHGFRDLRNALLPLWQSQSPQLR
jgi:hypothetical protein